jgi:hypothetical protein
MFVGDCDGATRPEVANHGQSRTEELDVYVSGRRTTGECFLRNIPTPVLIAHQQAGNQSLGRVGVEPEPLATPAGNLLCTAKPLQVGRRDLPLRSDLVRRKPAGTDVPVHRHVVDTEKLGSLAQAVGHGCRHDRAANSSLVMPLRSQQNVQSRARSAAVSLRRVRLRR